jgi:hypothetical protein
MRRDGLLAAGMCLAVAIAGCGGSGGAPAKAPTSRAALDAWATKADAACRTANKAIAKRGWPANLVDLDRLSVRAADDIREASAAIQKLPAPEGGEKRIAPFVDSVRRLDGLLEHVTDTTEKFKPKRLIALAPKLQAGLLDVERTSKQLGLRQCAANDEHVWVPDAIRAPVFAQQLADLDRKISRRSRGVATPTSTPQAAARKLGELSRIVGVADRGLSKLKPPAWAEDEADRYLIALRDLGAALDNAATEVSEPSISFAEAKRVQSRVIRAARLERRRFARLVREIGAIPTLPGKGGGGGEAPADDDTQAA